MLRKQIHRLGFADAGRTKKQHGRDRTARKIAGHKKIAEEAKRSRIALHLARGFANASERPECSGAKEQGRGQAVSSLHSLILTCRELVPADVACQIHLPDQLLWITAGATTRAAQLDVVRQVTHDLPSSITLLEKLVSLLSSIFRFGSLFLPSSERWV
jgi:hypothetical protein